MSQSPSTLGRFSPAVLTCVCGLLLSATPIEAQTGAHGYVLAGMAAEEGGYEVGDGSGDLATFYERTGLIGGGYAFPLRRGRLWIAGDLNSRVSGGYFDLSGGPSLVVGFGSPHHRLEPFAQVGPRWGDGANPKWNAGGGADLWFGPRVGLRIEYQYQWVNTFWEHYSGWGPNGPIGPPLRSPMRLDQHLIRIGIAIR